jgi:hypothetical protein
MELAMMLLGMVTRCPCKVLIRLPRKPTSSTDPRCSPILTSSPTWNGRSAKYGNRAEEVGYGLFGSEGDSQPGGGLNWTVGF